MKNEDLIGGLKRALVGGEKLQEAMMTFYRAGYTKEEIESAAREMQRQMHGQPITIQESYVPEKKKIIEEKSNQEIRKKPFVKEFVPAPKPMQRISNYGNLPDDSIKKIKQGINKAVSELNRIEFPHGNVKNELVQTKKVSNYENPKPRNKKTIIILIIVLVLLLGILGGVFLFKEEILTFFDNSSFFSGLFG